MTLSTPELPAETIDYEPLFERLSSGLPLVTGNSRLARVLHGQYNQWRVKRGDSQWRSPVIHSWDVWLGKLWDAASLQGIEGTGLAVPGKQQIISLWEQVLRNSEPAQRLLRPESLASQLRDTRRLAIDWQLDLNHPFWFGDEKESPNENHAAFYQWNRAFNTLCRHNNWIPAEDRTALLSRAARDFKLPVAGNFDLLGFDELDPAQLDLLAALAECGSTITRLTMTPAKNKAVLWQSKGGQDELSKMARWVRYWFEQEPEARIAVVVPDLQSRRSEVERHLAEILTPAGNQSGKQVKPWNTSMGTPLARVPLVDSAFDVLKLLDPRIDIQDIGRVLRSPWLRGGIAERNRRAWLEKCLRNNYPRQLKLSEVHYRALEIRKYDQNHQELPEEQHEPQAWNSPDMAAVASTLRQFNRDHQAARQPSAWAEAFDTLLASIGWPLASESESADGRGKIRAEEHDRNWQAFQSWQDGLRELASLDSTLPELGRKTAINRLHQICRERIFQPHTLPASIQVLGLYEISGLQFDHLWVLGLHNDNWPPSAQPNPFIPGPLQQEAQLPHSNPQRELEVARTVTRRLLETAVDTVFSYPGQIDGEPVLPSPLLSCEDLTVVDEVPGWAGDSWQSVVARATDPQIDPLEMPGTFSRSTAKGGSSILKNQALCPFRAFASNRLGAEGLETPVDGISATLHGSLMHSVLEFFWKETKTQEALLQLDEESLVKRIRRHVDHVLDEERGLKFRPEFRNVEANRLFRLALDYLEIDRARDPFEVVGFEKEILQEIEGQTIRLIIDRVDRLPSGDEAIIDYKTGSVDPKKWFGDRPEDPQLPLYAISAQAPPAAVVFAVIRDDGCLYSGVVRQGGIFPDLPPKQTKANEYLVEAGYQMTATIENWRQILHHLMADFLAGEAAIHPKKGNSTCKNSYCELHSLCRIGELEEFRKQEHRPVVRETAS
jgi:ATP-dependent helicase/nuclease subunit B